MADDLAQRGAGVMGKLHPTSAQYAFGVKCGKAVKEAREAGASYDEMIASLRHTIMLAELNRDLEREEKASEA